MKEFLLLLLDKHSRSQLCFWKGSASLCPVKPFDPVSNMPFTIFVCRSKGDVCLLHRVVYGLNGKLQDLYHSLVIYLFGSIALFMVILMHYGVKKQHGNVFSIK